MLREPRLRVTGLVVFELLALALLERIASVPWTDPAWRGWARWLDTTPPEEVIGALVWVVAVGTTIWLTATTVALAMATALRFRAGIRALSRITAGPLRRMVTGACATLLVGSSVIGSGAVAAAQDGHTPTQVEQPYTPTPAGEIYPPSVTHGDTDMYTVRPGDNFWVIASRRVHERERAADVAAVRRYWVDLVDRNRARIRSGDPNLIFPGEQVERPVVPPSTGTSGE